MLANVFLFSSLVVSALLLKDPLRNYRTTCIRKRSSQGSVPSLSSTVTLRVLMCSKRDHGIFLSTSASSCFRGSVIASERFTVPTVSRHKRVIVDLTFSCQLANFFSADRNHGYLRTCITGQPGCSVVRTLKHIYERNESRGKTTRDVPALLLSLGKWYLYLKGPFFKGMTKVERCVSTKKKA